MPYYKLGPIIRQRRQELGYTQEDLADGICAVNTLSRYENGERHPQKEHLEMLLQRLGFSDAILDDYVDEHAFYIHQLKYQIRQAVILHQFDRAKKLLGEFEKSANKNSRISQQFVKLYNTMLPPESPPEEQLSILYDAIRLTCPTYGSKKLPLVLSYEEIIIINNIALHQFNAGDMNSAIDALVHLKQYYETNMETHEETLRTQPMVLYNLSKYLGCAKRYDECIEVCDLGIRIARETGRCNYLSLTMYNKAWALAKRNSQGDLDMARVVGNYAKQLARIMGDLPFYDHVEQFLNSL